MGGHPDSFPGRHHIIVASMPRLSSAALTRGFAVGLILTAILHGAGYLGIRPLLPSVTPDLVRLLPLLWSSFAMHYVVLGVLPLLPAVTGQPQPGLVGLLAVIPLVDAGLPIRWVGIVLPAGGCSWSRRWEWWPPAPHPTRLARKPGP